MNNLTAVVTGATGYIGSRLVARLATEGWQVHAIVRPDSSMQLLEAYKERITLHAYDGTMESLYASFKACKPDVVFHLASLFLAEHEPEHIEPMMRANILFGTQLAEAMVRYRAPSLINTGTAWQHYQNDDYNPVCLYAATKQAMEALLTFYAEASSLRVITLKLFDTYGPGDPRKKLFALLQKTDPGSTPLLMSGGDQLVDLVYIDDVVNAYMVAADRLRSGLVNRMEQYAVSSGEPIPLKTAVALYESMRGSKSLVQWGARPYREREVMVPWSKGIELPGWKPQFTLTEGMRRIAQL